MSNKKDYFNSFLSGIYSFYVKILGGIDAIV